MGSSLFGDIMVPSGTKFKHHLMIISESFHEIGDCSSPFSFRTSKVGLLR